MRQITSDKFPRAGGNGSPTHVDCMIGSAQMAGDRTSADGRAEPLMRGGEWAA